MPRPSGTKPSILEQISDWSRDHFPPVVYDLIANSINFVIEFWYYVILAVGSVTFLIKFYLRNNRRQRHIKKLWQFMLFFLSKRQMILPLVYTLGKREKLLDEKSLQELLEARRTCQTVSLLKNPAKRLILEQKVSQMLFRFFSELEKTGKIRHGSKFERIMKDLEYIDQKLFSLRESYNSQVDIWNHNFSSAKVILYFPFGFRKFEKF